MKKISKLFKCLFFFYLATLLTLMIVTIRTDKIEIPTQLFGIDIDKIVHFTLFLPYPFLIWLAFRDSLKRRFKNLSIAFIAFSGILLAFCTEYAQHFNPDRNYDPKDILANILSIVVGTLLLAAIRYVWTSRLQ